MNRGTAVYGGEARARRSVAAGVVAVGAVLALGACSGGGQPPGQVQLDQGSSAAASESPSATTSATTSPSAAEPEAIRTSFPDIGFEIRDLPEVAGADRKVLATWATFVRGHHVMTLEARLNPMLTRNGSEGGMATMRNVLGFMKQNDVTYQGRFTAEVTDYHRRGRSASVLACYDTSELRMVERGEVQPGPAGGTARQQVRATLSFAGGRWVVTGYDVKDGTC